MPEPDASLGGRDTHPVTIRAHLEAIMVGRVIPDPAYAGFDVIYTKLDYQRHAQAAIDLLGEMEARLRAMIDYLECAGDPPCDKSASASCDECAVRWDCEHLLASLAPDPVASSPGAPRSNT